MNRKLLFLCLTAGLCLSIYGSAFALERIIYNDAGMYPTDTDLYKWYSFPAVGFAPATFNDTYAGGIPLDQKFSYHAASDNGNTYAGWGIFKLTGSENMSAFSGGYLKFWVKTSVDLKVEIKDSANRWRLLSQHGWSSPADVDTWKEIVIPLSAFGANLSAITGYFIITVESGNRTFYVDYVRWTTTLNETQGWDANIRYIAGNGTASSLTWSGMSAGADQYDVANQYVEVTVDLVDPISWRMIVYTNNTNYTGDTSAGGYGLVGANQGQGLPLAWKITEELLGSVDTPVFSTTRPSPDTTGFTDYQWKFVVDKTQTGSDAWNPNDTYIRAWDNSGFYWNEGVGSDMDPETIGNQPCPATSVDERVFIYFAAGFHQSLAQTYSTTSLTIEVLVL